MKKDSRNPVWAQFEFEIQKKAAHKDSKFVLKGSWKKFVRKQDGFKVYAVDGKWIRRNLCVYFGHGGHEFVHEFIPKGEIWVSTHHYSEGKPDFVNCNCIVKTKQQKVSKNYFESTIVHEITECKEMKKGKSFWESHQIALLKETELGYLSDPFSDI